MRHFIEQIFSKELNCSQSPFLSFLNSESIVDCNAALHVVWLSIWRESGANVISWTRTGSLLIPISFALQMASYIIVGLYSGSNLVMIKSNIILGLSPLTIFLKPYTLFCGQVQVTRKRPGVSKEFSGNSLEQSPSHTSISFLLPFSSALYLFFSFKRGKFGNTSAFIYPPSLWR